MMKISMAQADFDALSLPDLKVLYDTAVLVIQSRGNWPDLPQVVTIVATGGDVSLATQLAKDFTRHYWEYVATKSIQAIVERTKAVFPAQLDMSELSVSQLESLRYSYRF